MNIFLVSILYPSKNNPGHGVFVKNFESNMKAEGYNFVSKAVIKGISFNPILQFLNYLKLYYNILFKGLINSYDLIYVHYISHSTLGVFLLTYIKNKKLIFNVHGTDLLAGSIINKISRNLVRRLIKKNKILGFVVPSEFFKIKLLEDFIFDKNKVIVSPSGGINGSVFFRELNKSNHNVNDEVVLGYVSRIEENKGWDLYVKLIKYLKEEGYKVKAKVVGNGSQVDDFIRDIKENDLEVDFCYHGVLKQKELCKVYNSLDLFIFPTRADESLGLVGLEAMACGVPVIGSDVGGINTYLKNGLNGFLFKRNDIIDLISKTKSYINLTKSKKINMKEEALKTALQFDKDIITKQLAAELKRIYYQNEK